MRDRQGNYALEGKDNPAVDVTEEYEMNQKESKAVQVGPPPPHYQCTYARSITYPLSREKGIPHISGIGYHWQLQQIPLFPGFLMNLPETEAKKYPLSRENEKVHAAPLCIHQGELFISHVFAL